MKSLIFSIAILISSIAFSQEAPGSSATLRYYRLSDCTGWSNIPGSYSMYGCTFYPGSALVPEVNSLISILNAQETTIKSLEARIQALEQKN